MVLQPWLIIAAGVFVTVCLFWYARGICLRDFSRQFEARVASSANMVYERIGTDLLAVADMGELFQQSRYPPHRQLDELTVRYLTQYTEIEALGWVACVPHRGRGAYERRMRGERGRFSLTERNGHGALVPAAERDAYYPIGEWRPLKENEALPGLDIGSDPVLLDAIRKATDTARPVVAEPSKIIPLSHNGDQAFLLLVPIYEKQAEVETPEQRRGALKGLALGVLEAASLLSPFVTASEPGGCSAELLDVKDEGGTRVLGGVPMPATEKGGFISHLLPTYDPYVVRSWVSKGWAVRASPGQLSMARQLNLTYWLILPIGLMITLPLSFLMLHVRRILSERERMERTVRERTEELHRHEQHLEEVVRERTEDLRTANEALSRRTAFLEALLESTHDAITVVDAQRQKIMENRRFRRMRPLPPSIREDRDEKRRLEFLKSTEKDPEGFIAKVEYLYNHPGETSRDEIEGSDGTVLDRYSSPVLGRNGEYYGRIWTFHDITGLKQSEAALRESETRLRAILDSIQTGMVIVDPETHDILDLNPAAQSLIGAEKEKIVGSACHSFLCPAEPGRCPVADFGQTQDRVEGVLLTVEGKVVPIIKTVRRVTFGDRELFLETFIDITERKRAEETLAASEERYRTLFNDSPIAYMEADGSLVKRYLRESIDSGVDDLGRYLEEHGEIVRRCVLLQKIISVNRAMTDLYELPAGAEFAQMQARAHDEEFLRCFRGVLVAIGEGRDSYEDEVAITTARGNKRHVFVKWVVPPGYRESHGRVLISVTDITERKQVEDALRWKTAFLEALVDSSRDGIMVVDRQRRKVLQNRRFVELRKLPQHVAEEKDDEKQLSYVKTTVKGPDQYLAKINYLYSHPDETSDDEIELLDGTVLDRHSSSVLGEDGGYYGRIWWLHDITGRKRAEEALRESENKFKDLVEKSMVGVYLLRDGVFKYVNAKFAEITGYATSELIDRMGPNETVHPDDLDESFGAMNEGTSQSYQRQFRITTKKGEIRHVETYGTRTTYHGEPAIIGTAVDVTSRKIAEEALGWKTALLEAQINSTLDGILIVDREGRKILENQRAVDMWKIPGHFPDGHKQQFWHMIGMSRNPEQLRGEIRHLVSHPKETSRGEITLRDGTVLDTYSAPVFGEGGSYYGRIWTFRDITEIKRYWNMLENLSTTDGLTELPNRRRFDEFLEREWRRSMREATAISLILMDIDFFKEFNDHYGHLAGDDCLRRVSKILAGIVLRPGDLIARYGGEEFACVLPGTDLTGALVVVDKIKDVIDETNIPHLHSIVADHVTFSFGVATLVPGEGQASSDLISRADELLYAAKQSGRNRVKSWPQKTRQRKARIV